MRTWVVIVTVVWLAAVAGCAVGRDRQVIDVPGCVQAILTEDSIGSADLLDVRAEQCTSGSTRTLITEDRAFDLLGAAAWRTPGRTVEYLEVVLDHVADRSDDMYPRTFVLTTQQATNLWGPRAVAPGADYPRHVRNVVNGLLLVLGLSVAAVAVTAAIVLLAVAARHGHIVIAWRLR